MSATDALLERESEAARLAALIAAARSGRGGVAVIEGPAGIGKTTLIRHAVTHAEGMTVLSASGSELEHEFGFGVVRQLLERAAGGSLEGAAALAAPALGLTLPETVAVAPPVASPADARFAALHGLYWLVANLVAERPLLLAVDDAQWADEPSLRFLAYLARRVRELPVALVVAARPPLPGEDRSVLEAVAGEAEALAPAPLTAGAIAALAERRFGTAPPAFVEACRVATGGNALLVGEVLAELATPDPAAVEAAGVERMGRRVARRLAALGVGAEPLAAAVAVLGDGVEFSLAAALAELDLDTARGAAAELVAADLLEDAGTLRFRHPLIRAAVTELQPSVELGVAHLSAARRLAERGAPPGVIAAHLLAAPAAADPWVADALREAACAARDQGAPEIAATYLRRALAEPPAERVDVLLELGRAEHAAGAPTAAAHLEEAWKVTDSAEVALELASMLGERTRWHEAAAIARAALGRDAGTGETALHLSALLADVVRMDPTIGGDEPERLQALAATLKGETPGERHVIAAAAVITPVDTAEEHARAAELTQRTQADVNRFSETGIVSSFIRAGRLEQAEESAEAALEAARRGGFIQRHASILGMRGWIGFERGALPEARDDFESALAFAGDVALPPPVTKSNAAMLALVLTEQGEPAHADDLLERHGVGGDLPEQQVMNLILHFRSRVRALQGRTEEALADALETGRRYERLGLRRAVPPWRSLAATLTGDEALAREELELAQRWGTALALGLAERGLGLVTQDEAALRRAVAQLERAPNRLELARTRVELGALLRRQGRRADAREPLREAMDAAHACGAKPLAERARTELLATGARPRRLALQGSGALTPSERRVTELAANGLTNRQIAQELFVTMATVETHLRHAFRKLDVSSRSQLGAALRPRPA